MHGIASLFRLVHFIPLINGLSDLGFRLLRCLLSFLARSGSTQPRVVHGLMSRIYHLMQFMSLGFKAGSLRDGLGGVRSFFIWLLFKMRARKEGCRVSIGVFIYVLLRNGQRRICCLAVHTLSTPRH